MKRVLASWNQQAVLRRRAIASDQRKHVSAAKAEDALRDALLSPKYGHHPSSIHLRKRVYVAHLRHSREIDLILVTHWAIFVVEIKNWAGKVWFKKDSGDVEHLRFFQQPPHIDPTQRNNPQHPGTRALEFEDVVAEGFEKAKFLNDFMAYFHGIRHSNPKSSSSAAGQSIGLPQGCIIPCVVFTSPKVELDPTTAGAHPNVFTTETFLQFVGPALGRDGGVGWQLFTSLSPYGLTDAIVASGLAGYSTPASSGKLPKHASSVVVLPRHLREKVNAVLNKIRTWDTIYMHNGERFTGDLTEVRLCEQASFIHPHTYKFIFRKKQKNIKNRKTNPKESNNLSSKNSNHRHNKAANGTFVSSPGAQKAACNSSTERSTWQGSTDFSIDRNDILEVVVEWTWNNYIGLLLAALWFGYAGCIKITLKPGSPAAIEAVNQKIGFPDSSNLGSVTANFLTTVVRGSPTGSSSPSTASPLPAGSERPIIIRAVITHKSGYRKGSVRRDVEGLNHLVYRPAGRAAPVSLPLSHISALDFSLREKRKPKNTEQDEAASPNTQPQLDCQS